MKTWCTIIRAIDPRDGEMKTWMGPNVPGIDEEDARIFCDNNGLGYCTIQGEIVCEIPWNLAQWASELFIKEKEN